MSCRHDLALSTCIECYPDTGTINPGPGPHEPNIEGPGAVPTVVRQKSYDLVGPEVWMRERIAYLEGQVEGWKRTLVHMVASRDRALLTAMQLRNALIIAIRYATDANETIAYEDICDDEECAEVTELLNELRETLDSAAWLVADDGSGAS